MNVGDTYHGLKLLAYCGGGAFGEVFYCEDVTHKKMAVKIINKARVKDWKRELDGITRYRQITETSSYLLQIFHVEEDADTFYYTMEAADSLSDKGYKADTLTARLAKGPIPTEQLRKYIYSIFKGIKAIHKAGFAHRDIKPDNILFVKGVPKLADMGLMSSLDKTMTSVAGTPGFIPPELRLKDNWNDCDHKQLQQCDLYAFGKVIYCMATGEDVKNFPSTPPVCLKEHEINLLANLACWLCENDPLMRMNLLSDIEKELIHIISSNKDSEKGNSSNAFLTMLQEKLNTLKIPYLSEIKKQLHLYSSYTKEMQKMDFPVIQLRTKNFLKSIAAGFISLYKWMCKYKAATLILLAVLVIAFGVAVYNFSTRKPPLLQPMYHLYHVNKHDIKITYPASWTIYSTFNTEADQQQVEQFLNNISPACKDDRLNFILSYIKNSKETVKDNVIVCREQGKILGYIIIQTPYPLKRWRVQKIPYDLPHVTQWLYDYNRTNPPDFVLQHYNEIKIQETPCLKVLFTRKLGKEVSLCYVFQYNRQCFSITLTAFEQEFYKLKGDFESMINNIEIK